MVEPVSDSPEICLLLPHSGAMCLLDVVLTWDPSAIECQANSHRNLDNPLRQGGILPVHGGVEYAAQAMAIHGTLCERLEYERLASVSRVEGVQCTPSPRVGYLAALSNVDWYCSRLDDLPGPLQVQADKLMATSSGFNYAFRLYHGAQLLLQGQAVVALQDNPD